MIKFYTVINREIEESTNVESIKASGLVQSKEITLQGRNAIAYSAEGPYAPIEAVAIYESAGDQFIGQRI